MSGGFVGATLRRISAIDMDELFSYNTKKEVRMLDRRLGYLCWSVRLLVWGYIVGYVFIANEGYTQQEMAHGHVLTQVEGSTFSMTRAGARSWDAVDASRPSLENGALFVATQVLHTQHQVMGNCTSPSKKCSLDADCDKRPPLAEGICSAGMCYEMQWCPAQSETQSDMTDTHTLEGADGFTIWFKAAIQFTSLDTQRIFSTMAAHFPVRYVAPAAKAATAAARRSMRQVEATGEGHEGRAGGASAVKLIDTQGGAQQQGAEGVVPDSHTAQPNQFAVRPAQAATLCMMGCNLTYPGCHPTCGRCVTCSTWPGQHTRWCAAPASILTIPWPYTGPALSLSRPQTLTLTPAPTPTPTLTLTCPPTRFLPLLLLLTPPMPLVPTPTLP